MTTERITNLEHELQAVAGSGETLPVTTTSANAAAIAEAHDFVHVSNTGAVDALYRIDGGTPTAYAGTLLRAGDNRFLSAAAYAASKWITASGTTTLYAYGLTEPAS